MKERPIIFSSPMVKAILNGSKTQTRRIIRRQPVDSGIGYRGRDAMHLGFGEQDETYPKACLFAWQTNGWQARCQYGKPGDRLWVRETFFINDWRFWRGRLPNTKPTDTVAGDYYYRADGECCQQIPECNCFEVGSPWRPSIHMPRWASRISLVINEIRIERLQDISASDCIAEGGYSGIVSDTELRARALRNQYSTLWDALNEKRGFGWDRNPWVWVITFSNIGVKL